MREVLAMVERVHGQPLAVTESPRRAGDPLLLIADASRIRDVLGGQPQFNDLATIVRHALAWQRRLAKNPS